MVMLALSLGYWLGGHVADRWGVHRTLPAFIAGAGLTAALAPLVADVILPWTAELGPRTGSLVAAAAVFFAPSVLLATVSPLGVRLAAGQSVARIGRSAGSLYAVSTAGSILGTLATSFWLIPMLSLEPLIVWTATLLLAVALLALFLPLVTEEPGADAAGMRSATIATLALVGAGVLLGAFVLIRVAPAPATNEYGETVLFQEDTQYHRITVTEDETARHLRFDRSHQSAIDLDDEYASHIRYPDYFHLSLAVRPEAERTLVLGLGGGAVTKRMWRDYPEMHIDSVEIDPVVVDVARRYFALPEDERIRVFTEDARRYVQRSELTYDIVIVDAYYSDSLPFHLATREFLLETKARMDDEAVLAYNVISALEGDGSELFRSMYRTAGTVWDHLWVFPVMLSPDDTDAEANRNIIVLATDAELTESELLERIEGRAGGRVSIEHFDWIAEGLYTEMVEMADVPLLTDEHAPVDSLIKVN
jgi:spermidine synthase